MLPSKLRYLLPSTSDLVFVVLLISLSYGMLAPRLLGDADIGWHIRNGQNILATRTIPRTDSFSETMSGRPWYAWEWAYDAIMGAIYLRAGLNGVVLFSAWVIALALALAFRIALGRGGSLPITIVLLLISTAASSIHFLARPHVVSWLLSVVWFWILDGTDRGVAPRRQLVWLPLMMLAWVNLHGGFVMGFILVGIFSLAKLAMWLKLKGQEAQPLLGQARDLGLVLVFSALASVINPYGYKLHEHVYQYLTNRFLMQHIEEFRAPNFHGLPAQSFLLLLVMTILGILTARARLRWVEWLLLLFSAWFGLYAARNIPIASLLLMMVAAPLFAPGAGNRMKGTSAGPLGGPTPAFTRLKRIEFSLRGHVWPALLVIFSTVICLNDGRLWGKQVMRADFNDRRFPVAAVNRLKEGGNQQPIFSQDSWGGYLIYRLYPDTKVFIDDRHDFYGEALLRDYLKVFHLEPGWEQVLDGEGVNRIVIPRETKLAEALGNKREWKLRYQDEVAVWFERTAR